MSLPLSVRQQLLSLLREVSRATGATTASLLGRTRVQFISDARFIFIHVAAHHVTTREQIGEFLRRDRTTIDHAIRSVESLLKLDPDGHSARLVQALSEGSTSPNPQPNTTPAQPTAMQVRINTSSAPKLHIPRVADAARAVHKVLSETAADPDVTDVEMLTLLRETAAHCMSHYTNLRTERRRRGLEAAPFVDDRTFDAWITMSTEVEPERVAKTKATSRKHPPRNRRPATAAAPAA